MTDLDGLDWPTVPLGSLLLDIQPGFASGKHNSTGEGLPHFRPMNVSIEGRVERAVLKYVDPLLADRPERRLTRGDVVFNNTNSPELVGKTALFDGDDEPAFSNHMTRLRVEPSRLDPAFLALRLHQAWREGWFAARCNNHVSQASIGRDVLRAFEIELPPLDAQRAISALNRAVDDRRTSSARHLAVARRAVSRFRQAILTAACSGHLTADLRGSEDLVEGWPRVSLAGLCESITDGDHQAPPQVATGVPFITISAINDGQLRLERATRSVSSSYYEALKVPRRPKRGDVLFSVTGSIGIPALVDTDERFTFQRHIAILRPDPSRILSRYLLYVLGTSDIKKQGLAVATGTAQLTIPLGGLRSFVIRLPPVPEQQEIVRRVDQLLAVADGLRQRIDFASTRVDRSSQAVLAKAFRGDLPAAGDET